MDSNSKRYNEALDRAKKFLRTSVAYDRFTLESIFPELKEITDENIREKLIDTFESYNQVMDSPYLLGIHKKDIISWLKRQSDKASYESVEKEKQEFVDTGFLKCCAYFQDFEEGKTYWLEYLGNDKYNVRSDNLLGKTYHITPYQLYTIFKKQPWTETQDELTPNPYSGIGFNHDGNVWGMCTRDNGVDILFNKKLIQHISAETLGEEKQGDKIEPKLKIEKDQWYVCIRDLDDKYGTRVFSKGCTYHSTKDETLMPDNSNVPFEIKYCANHYFRLWTIQDAKDGDVLKEDSCTFIIERMKSDGAAIVHCCLFDDGDFDLVGSTLGFDIDSTYPATKEQRDLLFQKLKEAGYTFDFEKNELKKIKQEFTDEVKPKFHKGDYIVFNGLILYITEVVKGYYRTISNIDTTNSYDWNIDNIARLWTIQDAKNGDILVTADRRPFIYKDCSDPNHPNSPVAYCGIDSENTFLVCGSRIHYWWTDLKVQPATEEQRDSLIKAMVDAGYTFDFEKKELKKIEQESVNKVKPKFKVEKGKWYVCTQTFVLRGENVVIKGQTYKSNQNGAIEGENKHLFIDTLDGKASDYFRPWTIQDAKDGDVLCTYECIVIFKCIDGLNIKCYCTYHHFGFNPTFRINTLHNKAPFYPATKEQRDQLEKAMADAGYKWSVDKKELQKIKQESTNKVKPKFNVGDTMRTLEEASNGITNGLPVVNSIDGENYHCNNELIAIKDQDNYEYPPMNRRQCLISTDELAQAKKDAYNLALDKIEYHSSEPTFDDGWSAAIEYIKKKNLQSPNYWKPSEEQLNTLNTVLQFGHVSQNSYKYIKSLFQDLKKLKEV